MKVLRSSLATIKADLEAALSNYARYRAKNGCPPRLIPYLEILEEVHSIEAYVDSLRQDKTRTQYNALRLFLEGKKIEEIAPRLDGKTSVREVEVWVHGNTQAMGLVGFAFETFLKYSTWCPFCDVQGINSKGSTAPYPLQSRMCFHKELAWAGED